MDMTTLTPRKKQHLCRNEFFFGPMLNALFLIWVCRVHWRTVIGVDPCLRALSSRKDPVIRPTSVCSPRLCTYCQRRITRQFNVISLAIPSYMWTTHSNIAPHGYGF